MRADGTALVKMLAKLSGDKPVLWGEHIIGFGHVTLPGSNGRTVEWMRIACAVRAKQLTLYATGGLDRHKALLDKLGPYKRGGGCLHVRRLADINVKVLEELALESLRIIDDIAVSGAPLRSLAKKKATKKAPAAKKVAKKATKKKLAKKKAAKKR
jgi:hypothetical protein